MLRCLPFSLLAAYIAALPLATTVAPMSNVFGSDPVPRTWGPFESSKEPLKTMEQLAPKLTPFVIVDVEPQLRPTAKRQLVRYGPFVMPASKSMPGMAGHNHGGANGKLENTGIMNGGTGIKNLDIRAVLKGDVTLAIADYLSKSQDPEGFNIMNTIQAGLCKECTVLAAKLDAVFENGTRADIKSGVYLHHVVTFNMGQRRMPTDFVNQWLDFCPGGGFAEKMGTNVLGAATTINRGRSSSIFGFGSVDEFKQLYTTPDGKFDSGFYLHPKDEMLMAAELVNYRKEDVPIYIQIDFEWVPGKVGKEAVTGLTSVTDCADPMAFSGKGTRGRLISKGTPVAKPGTILSMRGHMHDGGESMSVFVNGKSSCTSSAEYSTGYGGDLETGVSDWTTISRMSECNGIWPVKKGDVVTLEAAFDEIKHPARLSNGQEQMEMGIVAFTFVQD